MRFTVAIVVVSVGCGRVGYDVTGPCTCNHGPCCDGCHLREIEAAFICDTIVETACDANACGASVVHRTGQRTCQGDTHQCTGAVLWGDWVVLESCDSNAVCDATATPSCQTCAHGCNAGACYPQCNPTLDACCDLSGTLECWPDTAAGLMWQTGTSASSGTHSDALAFCDNLSLSGHVDWRLPSISELRSLVRGCPNLEYPTGGCRVTDTCLEVSTCWVDNECDCPAGPGPGLDGAFAPSQLNGPWNCQDCFFWSSSEITPPPFGKYWAIHFSTGVIGPPLTSIGYARCVRDL